jgi:hypothetical protein
MQPRRIKRNRMTTTLEKIRSFMEKQSIPVMTYMIYLLWTRHICMGQTIELKLLA